ncbi:MAG: hypothetical protein ACREWE_00540 [Gammaproteobacteria bacterium]
MDSVTLGIWYGLYAAFRRWIIPWLDQWVSGNPTRANAPDMVTTIMLTSLEVAFTLSILAIVLGLYYDHIGTMKTQASQSIQDAANLSTSRGNPGRYRFSLREIFAQRIVWTVSIGVDLLFIFVWYVLQVLLYQKLIPWLEKYIPGDPNIVDIGATLGLQIIFALGLLLPIMIYLYKEIRLVWIEARSF